MIDKPLAIIPARGGSKRFPRKNIAVLAGKPLLAYTIEAARDSRVFHQICVSSDDEEILEIARKSGAHLPLKRPPALATDTAQVKHVCAYLLEYFAGEGCHYESFAVLLPTSPLRTPQDIREAYRLFEKERAQCVLSLVPFSHPPQRALRLSQGFVQPFFDPEYMKPAQALEPLYRHDGAVIFARSKPFLAVQDFYRLQIRPYFLPLERSVDIDSPLDLAWAEFLLSRLEGPSGPPGR